MQIEDKGSNAAYTLKHLYGKLLKPFEEHCVTRNRGGADLLGALDYTLFFVGVSSIIMMMMIYTDGMEDLLSHCGV
jgi:hypothetical protein